MYDAADLRSLAGFSNFESDSTRGESEQEARNRQVTEFEPAHNELAIIIRPPSLLHSCCSCEVSRLLAYIGRNQRRLGGLQNYFLSVINFSCSLLSGEIAARARVMRRRRNVEDTRARTIQFPRIFTVARAPARLRAC